MSEDIALDHKEIEKRFLKNGELDICAYNKLPVAEPSAVGKIFGTDTRVQVSDENKYPYSTIVRLIMKKGTKFYRGTGFFTKGNILLTAGHNVYDAEAGISYTNHQAFINIGGKTRTAAVTISYIPIQYKTGKERKPEYDWAIAKVDLQEGENCGELPVLQTDLPDSIELKDREAEIAGFPAEVNKVYTEEMYTANGYIEEYDEINKMLHYTISTSGGNSGSPVIVKKEGKYYAAGIHVDGGDRWNSAKAIESEIADKLAIL